MGISSNSYKIVTLRTTLSNAFLVVGPDSALLVDTGSPSDIDFIRKTLRRLKGKKLALIFLTHAHYDHFGSAAALSRLTGAPIAIHAADAEPCLLGETRLGVARGRGKLARYGLAVLERVFPAQGFMPDILLQDGERLDSYGFPAGLLHTPGHTPGSSTLFLDDGTAFAGDLVSTTGRPHAQRYYAQSWKELRKSLARLQAARPKIIYPGHGGPAMTREQLLAIKA